MDSVTKERILRYSVAVFSTIIATILRMELDPWIGDRVPFGTYLLSVLLTASIAGTGPAIASLFLGIFAAIVYILPQTQGTYYAAPGDMLALGIYAIVGAATISLFYSTTRQNRVRCKQLEQIEILTAELKIADRRKDEFLALLAHELRNPLAPIRNGLLLLQQEDMAIKDHKSVVKTMSRQLAQLVHIVDDLLDVSRFVHGKIRLELKHIDLRDLVEFALCQAKNAMEERQHQIQVLLPASKVIVNGDRNRITQIITNLLTNSAKYTPRQGRIQVILEKNSEEATLKVVDNGIGISKEMQNHIFELFTRSDVAVQRDEGGLGLGLPIARQFALMHGGKLNVVSKGTDQGSRFEFSIPLVKETRLNGQKIESDSNSGIFPKLPAPNETPAEFYDQKVLIVDDNVDAAETMSSLLSFYNFDTAICHDGFEALRMAEAQHPSIILLDIGMPGMNGYELAQRLRQDYGNTPLTLIAVTGWGDESDQQKSREAGIDHHLVKPVDPDKLTDLMRKASTVGKNA
ncbi:ATP-binding protein [uncultured Rubinisphaera sp.]|uniref:ATP-binding response regulator n=1 Tax=uncultured Rubinisphaera sp. TaxID=1678686 RepID=UPI0030DD3974